MILRSEAAMEPKDIISDEEIAAHHSDTFGPAMTPRRVVDEGVLKVALGYHQGSTMRSILVAHELVEAYDDALTTRLTGKGYEYLRAMFTPRGFYAVLDFLSI